MITYGIKFTEEDFTSNLNWEDDFWKNIETLSIDNFRPESSVHKPETFVKSCYNKNGINLLYKVRDKYIKCIYTKFNESVYKDSCVEFFIKPFQSKGYLNFEFNCGGNILASYKEGGNTSYLPENKLSKIKIEGNMPKLIEEEIEAETIWLLNVFIPFEIIEYYVGKIETIFGFSCRANFYKCADDSSHPHWAAWSPVSKLNFHLPECFGQIVFEK